MDGFWVVLAAILGYMAVTAISFGSTLALIISWSHHHSVLWALVHGWLNWLYVIYYCIRRKPAIA